MLVKEIKLKEIIERKIDYIKSDKRYQDIELKNVAKGELVAYGEMIYDIENMDEQVFVHKYIGILKRIEILFEDGRGQDCYDNNTEIEQLSGYNNAIVFVLALLNPQYEFEIRQDE